MSKNPVLWVYCCSPEDACLECKKYDQLVYEVGEGPTLPRHPNCKCYYRIIRRTERVDHYTVRKSIPSNSNEPSSLISEPSFPESLSYEKSINRIYEIIEESNNLDHVSDALIELLKKYETPYSKYLIKDSEGNTIGIKPYNVGDGGITVGYGHFVSYKTMERNPSEYALTQRNISVAEATDLMKKDLAYFEKQILSLMENNDIYLVQHEFDALVLQAYNYGNVYYLTELLKSGNRNRQDWIEAITKRMEVNKGKYYNGLMNRRYQELDLFLYADYNGGPDVKKYP